MPPSLRTLVIMALAVTGCGLGGKNAGPLAKAGVMDLSGWDFESQGPVSLRGDWMFRYGELLGPSVLSFAETPSPPMIEVPSSWNEATRGGVPLRGRGVATHALRLTLPRGPHTLGMAFGEAHSAERLWVNGRLALERGRVGASPESEVPGVPGRIVALGELGGTVDIVLETSNHFHYQGGPLHAPRLGPLDQLERRAESDTRVDFFLIGCLLVPGLFYLALSLTRPDRDIVLFGFLSLLMALRTATINWHITSVLPMGAEAQLRLDYVILVILPVVFCALIAELFKADVPRVILRLAFWYVLLALIGPLALDTETFTALKNVNIGMGALFASAAVLSVARAALRGRQGARLLLAGSVLLLASGLREGAITLRLIPESRELLPIASTIFVFAHAVVLGGRLSDALRASERSTASLQEANALLEQRIEDRTRELERVAMTDALTGLWNRRPLMKLAEAERARAVRSKQLIGAMMIDCDDFKLTNDIHGHDAGDRVLKELGQRFQALVRGHDLLGRWGGEEFVMIFSTPDRVGAEAAAERVRQHVADTPFETGPNVSLKLTVSVGVALLDDGLESFDDLLRRADQALYRAKAMGKDRVVMAANETEASAE